MNPKLENAFLDLEYAFTKFKTLFLEDKDSTFISVGESDNLQDTIDNAPNGATLLLYPQARYKAVKFPAKKLTVRTKGDIKDGRITRESISFAGIENNVFLGPGSEVVLQGLEIFQTAPKLTAVSIGRGDETDTSSLPISTVIDSCWIHADRALGGKRGIAANGRQLTLSNSIVEGFWEEFGESQAVCGWNGPGPFTIVNNFLEATGENVMFGGSDGKIQGVSPSNLLMVHNYLHKPDEWRSKRGAVKNIFELKNMRKANIFKNIFSGSWVSAQAGHGILFTVRNQNGTRPDS